MIPHILILKVRWER